MTAQELAQLHNVRAKRVETEFRKTMRDIGQSAVSLTKQLMTEEIYAIPEDVNPRTGKKRWKRTGTLRRNEKFEVRGLYEVAIVNATPYAIPRHEAGKPGARKINPVRESHWRDELLEKFGSFLEEGFALTMRDILEAKS